MQGAAPMGPTGGLPAFSFNAALQQTAAQQPFQSSPMQSFGPGLGLPGQQQTSPFGQSTLTSQQAFGQPSVQPTQQQLPFGQPSMPPAQQPQPQAFGQPVAPQPQSQPVQQNALSSFSFAMNTPGQPPAAAPAAPFGTGFGSTPTQSPFGGVSPFGGATGTAPTSAGAFGSPQGFGSGSTGGSGYDKNIYTDISELTPEEIKAFEAPQFDANSLPLRAPAKQFCL